MVLWLSLFRGAIFGVMHDDLVEERLRSGAEEGMIGWPMEQDPNYRGAGNERKIVVPRSIQTEI